MGGDLWSGYQRRRRLVSIHASAWEATRQADAIAHPLDGFNPRLRVGGDKCRDRWRRRSRRFQSTPPRGRRHYRQACTSRDTRFNPRLRVGGDTPLSGTVSATLTGFQSTPPRGRRQPQDGFRSDRLTVSIHASAWEATCITGANIGARRRFQSTPPRGRRRPGERHVAHSGRFQSTPPRGRRPRQRLCGGLNMASFNPRLRVGGDKPRKFRYYACGVSIHASAWEATVVVLTIDYSVIVSIHASAWEATVAIFSLPAYFSGFNPRLRVGGESSEAIIAWTSNEFQSTPPRGRRPPRNRADAGQFHVSIHASAWEATHARGPDHQHAPVSIHASAWEATSADSATGTSPSSFNPRLRVGGELALAF